jgi:Tfp pilus assembly protein PilF
MKDFEKYIEGAKEQLDCNAAEDYKYNYGTYLYTNEQIESNLDYFRRCMESGLSSYKALLFFNDYLEGDYLI